jgi:DNA-binding transcriptional MerR regulator
MKRYSIKDLEKLSGIKAHTLRIWEKRYDVIEPKRTPTNIRFYTDNDLRRVLNIALLNNHGIKISSISTMSKNDIRTTVKQITDNASHHQVFVDSFLIAMIDMDEAEFNRIFEHTVNKFGFSEVISRIIYPFLEKTGIMWGLNDVNPYHEHFVSSLIKRKISYAIENLKDIPPIKEKIILYLPQNELHEIGLLFAHYLLKRAGYAVYYFGPNLPFESLKEAVSFVKPDSILTFIVTANHLEQLNGYLATLSTEFIEQKIYLSGRMNILSLLLFPSDVRWIRSVSEFGQIFLT